MQNYSNTGIEHDSYKAPWNQKDQKEEEFQCLCSQTLSKSALIFSSSYTPIAEDGVVYSDTANIDWEEEYHDNDHYTPLQLIGLFKQCLEENLKNGLVFKNPGVTQRLIEECEGWTEDETEYVEG